jgi:hypothetical protein
MKRRCRNLEPIDESRETEQRGPDDKQLSGATAIDHELPCDASAMVFTSSPVDSGRFLAAFGFKWV